MPNHEVREIAKMPITIDTSIRENYNKFSNRKRLSKLRLQQILKKVGLYIYIYIY